MLSWLHSTFDRFRSQFVQARDALAHEPEVAFLVRVSLSLGRDDASHMAAGLAYYAFLSLFPLLLGIIALLGLFLPSQTVQQQVFNFIQEYAPAAADFIVQNVTLIIQQRGTLGIISLTGLFWGSSAVFGVIRRVLNRAWHVNTVRPLYIAKPMDIGMAIGTGFLVLLSLGATIFLSIINQGPFPLSLTVTNIAGRFLSFLLVMVVFTAIYKYMPNCESPWRYVWPGALLGSVLFEAAKVSFVYYLNHFAAYSQTYGSIASFIILLVWIYVSSFILVIGAEFSAEYGRMHRPVR